MTIPMVTKAWEKKIPVTTEVEAGLFDFRCSKLLGLRVLMENNDDNNGCGSLTAGGQNGLLSGNIGFPASQVATTATKMILGHGVVSLPTHYGH